MVHSNLLSQAELGLCVKALFSIVLKIQTWDIVFFGGAFGRLLCVNTTALLLLRSELSVDNIQVDPKFLHLLVWKVLLRALNKLEYCTIKLSSFRFPRNILYWQMQRSVFHFPLWSWLMGERRVALFLRTIQNIQKWIHHSHW